MFQHLIYYSWLIDPTAILFFHRDEDIHGREHWLLFHLDGRKRECIDPLDNHQKIYNSTQITADMDIVAAYLLGETVSFYFSFESVKHLTVLNKIAGQYRWKGIQYYFSRCPRGWFIMRVLDISTLPFVYIWDRCDLGTERGMTPEVADTRG
jgi:hypothetical protein